MTGPTRPVADVATVGEAPAISLPELATEPHVLVVSVPTDRAVHDLVRDWARLDDRLAAYAADLEAIVAAVCGEAHPGEVAVFLSYRARDDGLVGGAALLSLEPLDPISGSTQERAAWLAGQLRLSADRMGHVEGLAEVAERRTSSGVPAVRLRFFSVLPTVADLAGTPMVEACRWLYPVPGHPDLAWSLLYQTTDLVAADDLVAEFDRLAGSLTWSQPDSRPRSQPERCGD